MFKVALRYLLFTLKENFDRNPAFKDFNLVIE
jgi:hypothetical protein